MEYFVIGADGNKYGPASVQTLQLWIQEGRIGAQSMLEEGATGRRIQASTVPGLFAATVTPQPQAAPAPQYGAYPRQSNQSSSPYVQQESSGPLVGIIVRSAAAVLLFFVFKGLGLFVGGYALYYAIQLKSNGSKYGTVAIVIAGCAFGAVALGWFLRLQGAGI